MRTEHDKLGQRQLPDGCLYGINTLRATENFALGGETAAPELIEAMVRIKRAAALVHGKLGELAPEKADAIVAACDKILAGQYREFFVTHPLQGGAGTSTHMNVCEVVANAALLELGEVPGSYDIIHPLGDVNLGASTNDVYPTALRIAAIFLVRQLSDQCARLQEALQQKETQFERVMKLGRTELMDALPITLGQEFGAWAAAVSRDRWRIYKVEERLRFVNLGGTAIGTGTGATRKFSFRLLEELRRETGIGLARAEYPMDVTQSADVFVEVSGLLKALATTLGKISGDLRLMNMGPGGGLGEIHLPDLQQGSTIMPGKVNPVMTEMMTQIAIEVTASDSAIAMCAMQGQLELNAFLPLIAEKLLRSLNLLIRGVSLFREKCIEPLTADETRCRMWLDRSLVLVTALTPYLGYDEAARLHDQCGGDPSALRKLILSEGLMDEETLNRLLDYRAEGTYLGSDLQQNV